MQISWNEVSYFEDYEALTAQSIDKKKTGDNEQGPHAVSLKDDWLGLKEQREFQLEEQLNGFVFRWRRSFFEIAPVFLAGGTRRMSCKRN